MNVVTVKCKHGSWFWRNFISLFRPVNGLECLAIAKQNQFDVKLLSTANFVKPRLTWVEQMHLRVAAVWGSSNFRRKVWFHVHIWLNSLRFFSLFKLKLTGFPGSFHLTEIWGDIRPKSAIPYALLVLLFRGWQSGFGISWGVEPQRVNSI